jgi:acetyltransferase-like isoleucine patch superfamily enzyme
VVAAVGEEGNPLPNLVGQIRRAGPGGVASFLRKPPKEQVDWARIWWAYEHRYLNARWHLRDATVGRNPSVIGRPLVEVTDAVIGDDFLLWSGYRRTLVGGWGRIRIGDRCFINCGTVVMAAKEVVIEDEVAIANEAYITDTNSHGVEGRPCEDAPIRIGRGSWVGARAIILPGVTIGSRCLVAAGTVVTKDVPDDSLVAGNPGRVVRKLEYPEGVTRAWWDG